MRRKTPVPAGSALRHRAEARLHPQDREAGPPRTQADARRLVHELQVHQVELELQNAELQEARDRVEALLDKYTDLYDFAPVGYFSLDERGQILEANLTGAALLGVERSRLIHQRLTRFVAPVSRSTFLDFLHRGITGAGKEVCEAKLVREDGTALWADCHTGSAVAPSGERKWCRVAVSDISALRRAEEAERRLEALAMANRELTREIVRRQAVEQALKHSKQDLTRLLDQSRRMQGQLRHLSHRILQAQEEERKRISRELHDEITQTLVGINVHLEALARQAHVKPRGLTRQIVRTQRLVMKSVSIVHQFARELRPTALDDLGLVATLHSFLHDFAKRTGIRVHFTTFARVEQLSGTRRTVLYRVVQSALTNVAQHAQASQVGVNIRRVQGSVRLQIADDGRSFEVERVLQARGNRHLGLIGMRERLEMVGGNLSIDSAPGRGTTIRATIPFRRDPEQERAGSMF